MTATPRFPFTAFPKGWFSVAFADDVPADTVVPLTSFGVDLVAWRDETGQPTVMDAFCPHQGAHFGYGGKVEGDSIRCPFHAWRFSKAGICTDVPYSSRTIRTSVTRFPTEERFGHVLVWWDGFGHGGLPEWDCPEVAEYDDPTYSDYVAQYHVGIHTNWREIKEGAVDQSHAQYVHGSPSPAFCEIDVVRERFVVTVRPEASDALQGAGQSEIVTTFVGPGVAIVRMRGGIDAVVVSMSTPVDEDTVMLRMGYVIKRQPTDEATTQLGELIAAGHQAVLAQDIPILEHKKFRTKPLLVPEDGPILAYRRWAGQFDPVPVPLDEAPPAPAAEVAGTVVTA